MHPPRAICEQLARIHPKLRFAWHGREKRDADELNPGSFAIVQLYHISNAGTQDNPNTYRQPWEEAFGPIFNKQGGTTRDWDPLFWTPMYVTRLEDVGVTHSEVFNGQILDFIRDWMIPVGRRAKEDRRRRAKELHDRTEDIIDAMTDRLWYEANKTGEETIDVPWEFAKKDVYEMYKRKRIAEQYLDSYYDVPGM